MIPSFVVADDITPLVIQIGRSYGLEVDERYASIILWEETGFPCFWDFQEGETTWEEVLERQVHTFFRSVCKAPLNVVP